MLLVTDGEESGACQVGGQNALTGATALISPTPVPEQIVRYDNLVMTGSAFLLLAFARTGYRVVRLEGAVLLSAYILYIWSLWPQV